MRTTKINPTSFFIFHLFIFIFALGVYAESPVQDVNSQKPDSNSSTYYVYPQGDISDSNLIIYQASKSAENFKQIKEKKVKNVIYFIGDGMGLAQVNAARMKAVGLSGKLHMERMPATGIMRTHSFDSCVTDSAAAGTALATGFKTNNGVVSKSPDGHWKYTTILEAAMKVGMATGLVVTSTINHATPAVFGSHVDNRGMYSEIAESLIENRINVLFGGGREWFLPDSIKGSERADEKNLIARAKSYGYEYVEQGQDLKLIKGPYVLGLFQMGDLKTNEPEPSLAELTVKAIDVLNTNKKGFFLMVEGSQIDWACHSNNLKNTIKQVLLFDMAVKEAMEFAMRDKHTIVIVTADHETGGLAIIGCDSKSDEPSVKWTTGGHTGLSVPVYAYGPGVDKFSGVYDNTELPQKIAALLAIKEKDFPKSTK